MALYKPKTIRDIDVVALTAGDRVAITGRYMAITIDKLEALTSQIKTLRAENEDLQRKLDVANSILSTFDNTPRIYHGR